MNELDPILKQLTAMLAARQFMITTAESCTGGLIASLLTELPGSSNWFDRGFITYSNAAKEEMLGVSIDILKQYGAVSKETAEAMAVGALKHSKAHAALAVTGIAGPDGGTIAKPVGTVWFAFAHNSILKSMCCNFTNRNRQQIRQLACQQALQGMMSLIAEVQ